MAWKRAGSPAPQNWRDWAFRAFSLAQVLAGRQSTRRVRREVRVEDYQHRPLTVFASLPCPWGTVLIIKVKKEGRGAQKKWVTKENKVTKQNSQKVRDFLQPPKPRSVQRSPRFPVRRMHRWQDSSILEFYNLWSKESHCPGGRATSGQCLFLLSKVQKLQVKAMNIVAISEGYCAYAQKTVCEPQALKPKHGLRLREILLQL